MRCVTGEVGGGSNRSLADRRGARIPAPGGGALSIVSIMSINSLGLDGVPDLSFNGYKP